MIENEYVEKVMKHKHALTCTQGMATVMAAKKDAEECFQDMKDNAEDIVVDANSEVKKEIYVEDKE